MASTEYAAHLNRCMDVDMIIKVSAVKIVDKYNVIAMNWLSYGWFYVETYAYIHSWVGLSTLCI